MKASNNDVADLFLVVLSLDEENTGTVFTGRVFVAGVALGGNAYLYMAASEYITRMSTEVTTSRLVRTTKKLHCGRFNSEVVTPERWGMTGFGPNITGKAISLVSSSFTVCREGTSMHQPRSHAIVIALKPQVSNMEASENLLALYLHVDGRPPSSPYHLRANIAVDANHCSDGFSHSVAAVAYMYNTLTPHQNYQISVLGAFSQVHGKRGDHE